MSDYDSVDYFTDLSLVTDPYPYFDHLRQQCPVQPTTPQGVVAITGHSEAIAAYRDPALSSCVSVTGPFPGLPFEPQGDDIGDQIARHRDQIPMSEHMVTMDPPDHTQLRGLLSRLLTPKRLSENEDFMWGLADRQLDEFIDRGRCEFLQDFARPFSLLVIADLLGVPKEQHDEFLRFMTTHTVGGIEDDELPHNPLEWLDQTFSDYVIDRRARPREDVLTELAQAKHSDGSTPEVIEVVRLATFLFAAGMETTTKLLSAAMRVLGERPAIQQALRSDRDKIPEFLEETLRLESPVKSHFRVARRSTVIGGTPIPAGTTVMLLPGASNRDPRKFADPNAFHLPRRNVREHLAFGRGVHTCPGAPLARAEGRISLNRILDRMTDISINHDVHGPPGASRYSYEPTYMLRGLTALHLTFRSRAATTPARMEQPNAVAAPHTPTQIEPSARAAEEAT
ncbi:cytochrome P450 [Mycobacterium avium subsp. hominissuis]|uniref:cytochrome P450 n=1 Tax=Mycobacterium avium TaxID=1764 RepID=UPI0009FD63AE|nr:cytochrome P450 [Mycobacterium avium]